MSAPTRFPNGVTTAARGTNLDLFGQPDPTKWVVFFDDFTRFVTGDWTTTAVGAGSTALADVAGGAILLTNAAADNDSRFLQKLGEAFLPSVRKRTIFKARFKVSDAVESDFVMGLQITDTTPLAAGGDGVTDGIFFQKDDGSALVTAYCQKDTTTGQTSKASVATVVSDTFIELGFVYDGKRSLFLYVDNALKATLDLTATPTTYLPDTELCVSFGVQNGEAVAKTMTVDYVFAAQER